MARSTYTWMHLPPRGLGVKGKPAVWFPAQAPSKPTPRAQRLTTR